MASIPQEDQNVVKIYKGIVENHNEARRAYLGASSIGASCSRQLWMGFRWVKKEKFDGRQLRLFETGHLEEARFTQNLRNANFLVHDVDPTTNEQFGVQFHGGHFRGHTDGVALRIEPAVHVWHLLEYKTHGEKSFKLLQKDGMIKSKPMHHAQMQVYMKGMNLDIGYYLAKNKNTDELYGEVVEYDEEVAHIFIDRAKTIIFDSEPSARISDNPSWYECKWCNYSDYCHGTGSDLPYELPEVNCRTCIHATPVSNGTWDCERDLNIVPILEYEDQVEACEHHKFIPNLFPDLEFERADSDNVFYRSRSGEVYNNAEKGVMIHESSGW